MPNISPDQATEIIQDAINNFTRHSGYQRSIDLFADYFTIITGKDWPRFLTRFVLRESKEDFNQRIDLTHQNLSSTANPILKKVDQLSRVQDIKKGVDFTGTSDRDQRDLLDVLADFGGQGSTQKGSLEDFVTRSYDQLSQYDPNAFIVLDFENFNAALGERARPYGILFPCSSVLNFRYTRGMLDYLLVSVSVTYKEPVNPNEKNSVLVTKVATDYILFGGPFTLRYYQQGDGRVDIPDTGVNFTSKSDTIFTVAQFLPGIDEVPAVRVGDLPDLETGGSICISRLLHAPIDQFKELINTKSQLDIIKRKHAFPRRYERAPLCAGELMEGGTMRAGCNEGINMVTGATCKECNGTGFAGHRSEQDIIRLKLDDNMPATDIFDLSKLSYVEKPDMETVEKFQDSIDALQQEIYMTAFSASQQMQVQGVTPAKTASEFILRKDNENNTLLPVADQKSFIIKSLVRFIVKMMHISGEVKYTYEFSRDLRLSSADDLLGNISEKSATVNASTLEQMYDDYNEKVYEFDSNALDWYRFKKKHISFLNMPDDKFSEYASLGYIADNDITRKVYCDDIVADLQNTIPGILEMSYEQQEVEIDTLVEAIQAKLVKPVSMSIPKPVPQVEEQIA